MGDKVWDVLADSASGWHIDYIGEALQQRSFVFNVRRFADVFMKALKVEDNHVAGLNLEPEEAAKGDSPRALEC